MFALTALTLLLVSISNINAAVTPTSPESATSVKIGQPLTATWSADMTGTWTDMTVQLMTGDNLAMVPLAVLSTGIDGTKETTHSWTTPNVSPTSKIYFLQFTKTGDPSTAQWTTRFTIASTDGTTSTPANSTTYTAAQGPIQWGIGAIVGGGANGTSPIMPTSNSTSPSASGAAGVIAGGSPVNATTSPLASTSAVVVPTTTSSSSTMSVVSSTSKAASSISAASAGAASPSSSKAAAGKLEVGGIVGLVAGLVGVALL